MREFLGYIEHPAVKKVVLYSGRNSSYSFELVDTVELPFVNVRTKIHLNPSIEDIR